MNADEIVIVIPAYKETLEWYETMALQQLSKILGYYHICLCCPKNLCVQRLEKIIKPKSIERFDNKFFSSIDTYNQLMMSCEFYERFIEFRYMLIYQMDAFVFNDKLHFFCDLEYDYIGAPWLYPFGDCRFKGRTYRFKVGNGGLSLRNIKKFIEVTKEYREIILNWEGNEDQFYAYCGFMYPEKFRVAPTKVAYMFSYEVFADRLYKKSGYTTPFGCHAWMRYGGEIYFDLFKKAGFNLKKDSIQLQGSDFEYEKCRIERRFCDSVMRLTNFSYLLLCYKKYAIVCFGKIGKRLADFFFNNGIEVNTIYDSKFVDGQFQRNQTQMLSLGDVDSLSKNKGRIIIATYTYEKEFFNMFDAMGWSYGVDYISVCKEYAKRFSWLGYEKHIY